MALPKLEERTLYSPIIEYLKNLGFDAVGETTVTKKHPDILFKLNSTSFVIEVKIGKPEVGLGAMAQAYGYAKKLRTENIIILVYPEKFRNQTILDMDVVPRIALDEEINALILTEFWTEKVKDTPKNIFKKLKTAISIKKIKIDFKTVVDLIGSYVRDLNSIIYHMKTDELISEVVDKLELFTSIGEIKDKELAKKQIMNLASYLLFNQLLFYHIYKRRTKNAELDDLNEIHSVKEIQNYFDMITDIDYQSIYRVNILGHVPERPEIIQTLNELINAIKLLRAEHITHDLAGRFFHDLIPSEVRKVLAAFYTHPNAAKILADLTIDSWDKNVIDPACGSGTLLVSAYGRKQELYQRLYGFKNMGKIHKKFIEEDITGIDIMPFAGHITTINLTMQDIEQETNIVRIGCRDSLSLAGNLKSKDFTKLSGIKISSYSEKVQKTLSGIYDEKVKGSGAISPRGKGEEFYLKPFDVLIMNPPFSDREKMPEDMREKIKNNRTLGSICGHRINLWGYFLALADLLLKPNGKMGVVIPMNIARGRATEKIRNFLLKNYHMKYIVIPVGDMAFSEGADFRDILLIAEKRKPKEDDITGIIYVKDSIRELSLDQTTKIINKIRNADQRSNIYQSEEFEIVFLCYEDIINLKDNLMPVLGFFYPKNIKIFKDFSDKLIACGKEKLTNLAIYPIQEGFHASPAGISELTFITAPFTKDRIKRAFLVLESEFEDNLVAKIRNTEISFEIKKSNLLPALRTLTSVNKFFVEKVDYFLRNEPENVEKLIMLSKFKRKEDFTWDNILQESEKKGTYLAVARRFRPNSKNTHFFAFYNNKKFIAPHTFKIIKLDEESSKYQCLFLNSIVTLADMILYREQTTAGYTDIMESELVLFNALNTQELTKKDKKVLDKVFDEIKVLEFPSILKQLENRFPERIKLDKAILGILGFSDEDINRWLPKMYNAVAEELKAMKGVK